ncbi:MAG: type II toxin-antitoxin system Phd/YefM family antitoxin [Thermoleophilia bacterium]
MTIVGRIDMNVISATAAKKDISGTLSLAEYGKERVVITRQGKEVAAIVPMEDVRLLEELEDRLDLIDALEALKEADKMGSKSWSALKKELGF